jgi:hypothetical protein
MSVSLDPGVWLGAFLIISVSAIAVKESWFSRWGEYAILGSYAGVALERGIRTVRTVTLFHIGEGKYIYIIMFVLGALIYSRYVRKYMWLARYAMSVLVGVGIGDIMRAVFEAQVMKQVLATAAIPTIAAPLDVVTLLLGLVMSITSTWYFVFSITPMHSGRIPRIAQTIARYGLVTAFGTAFAGSVMARLNSYSRAVMYILFDWLGLA